MGKSTSNFDYFGVGVDWNYKGSSKHKTIPGVFVTLIFFGLTLYSIITISLTLFNKKDPEVTKSIFFESDPGKVSLSPEDFSFAVGLQDPHDFIHFIDETIYTLKGVYQTQNRSLDDDNELVIEAKSYELDMTPCTLENFGSNSDMFEGLALQNLLCPSLDQDLQLELEGVWESPTYSTLDFLVYPCVNSTENGNHCKSSEEIEYWLEGAYFVIHFADQSVDPENFDQPRVSFRNSYFGMVSTQMFKHWYFYIKHMTIETDKGILYSVMDKQNMVGFDKAFETTSFAEVDMVMQFRLKLSSQAESFQRRYHKLTYVLAEITGLLKTYIIIIVFVITPLQKFHFQKNFVRDNFVVTNEWLRINTKKHLCGSGKDTIPQCSTHEDQNGKSLLSPRQQEDFKIQVEETKTNRDNNNELQIPTENLQLEEEENQDQQQETDPNEKPKTLDENLKKEGSIFPIVDQRKKTGGNLILKPSGDDEESSQSNVQIEKISEDQIEIHQIREDGMIEAGKTETPSKNGKAGRMSDAESQSNQDTKGSNQEAKGLISKSDTQNQEMLADLQSIEKQFYDEPKVNCKVSSWDFVKAIFGWHCAKTAKSKKLIFDIGCKNLEDILDIEQYFITKKEVKLLKKILLTAEQKEVFDKIINQKTDISDDYKDKKRRKSVQKK